MLHGGARRNQRVQSPGSESQARVGAVLQSLLRDISVSSLPSGAQRKEMVQSLGNERRGRVGGVLQSLLTDISLSTVADDASSTARVLQQVEASR